MKFKVGDKVRVRGNLVSGKTYNDCYFADSMRKYKSREACITEAWETHSGSRYHIDICTEGFFGPYCWSDDMLALPHAFTKSDLKDGMVVENREGNRYIVLNGAFMRHHGFCAFKYFNDDLTETLDHKNLDIMKVYEASSPLSLDDYMGDRNLTLIWEREEKPEPKAKYEVGDMVKIKNVLKPDGPVRVSPFIWDLAGTTQIISKVHTDDSDGIIRYNVAGHMWYWTESMIEGLVEYKEMTVEEIEKKLGHKIKVVGDNSCQSNL